MMDENIAVTRGFNMAFGVLSKHILDSDSAFRTEVLETLLVNCLPKGRESDCAEQRKQAVKSVASLLETTGLAVFEAQTITKVLETLFKAVDDYALDNRGDVGSWVREEAMRTLSAFVT